MAIIIILIIIILFYICWIWIGFGSAFGLVLVLHLVFCFGFGFRLVLVLDLDLVCLIHFRNCFAFPFSSLQVLGLGEDVYGDWVKKMHKMRRATSSSFHYDWRRSLFEAVENFLDRVERLHDQTGVHAMEALRIARI
jgi:hypothetical protein